MKRYFDRQAFLHDGRFQIWERRGGDSWQKLADNDRFRDEYGPYRRR